MSTEQYNGVELGQRQGGGVNLDRPWGDRARVLDEVPYPPGEVLEGRTVSEAPETAANALEW
jgi:hypothetical protein